MMIVARYKYFWHQMVLGMLKHSKILENQDTPQAAVFEAALRKTIRETENMQDGPDRIRAVELLYIKKTKTKEGVADELHVSTRTVDRWASAFINRLGHNMGY